MTWALDNLGDLDFGQHAYSNDWETFVLKNLTHAFEAESISGFFFLKYFLPPVMHPEIVSGMGIATNIPFGSESSLFSNDIMQFLFEQVIK